VGAPIAIGGGSDGDGAAQGWGVADSRVPGARRRACRARPPIILRRVVAMDVESLIACGRVGDVRARRPVAGTHCLAGAVASRPHAPQRCLDASHCGLSRKQKWSRPATLHGQRHAGAPGSVARAVTCALPQPLNRRPRFEWQPPSVRRFSPRRAGLGRRTGRRPPPQQDRDPLASRRGGFGCPCS